MDAQTEQLTAPPGWTKKLVPASGKSITLRKYDVVFIAPDGQELKSKWHLTRYLKAHPDSPAISEFDWNSGEEAPIRRSSRFATKQASEDDKSTSKKKGKRDAAEMEDDQEKGSSRKQAKKARKSEVFSEKQDAEEVEADVSEKDEVMLEAIAGDNEATLDAVPPDEVQKDVGADAEVLPDEVQKDVRVDAKVLSDEVQKDESADANVVEAVIEKALDEGLDEQVKEASLIGEQEDVQAKDEGLETVVVEEQITVSSANIVGEHEEIKETVIEGIESILDEGENTEYKAAQESTLVAQAEDLKVEEIVVETTVIESVELVDQKTGENEGDVFCKVTAVTSVEESFSEEEPLGPMVQQEEEPLEMLTQKEESVEPLMEMEDPVEPLTQKEDLVEPLMQKEEQERPVHMQNSPQHMKDKSPSEFNSGPVPLGVANHQ